VRQFVDDDRQSVKSVAATAAACVTDAVVDESVCS